MTKQSAATLAKASGSPTKAKGKARAASTRSRSLLEAASTAAHTPTLAADPLPPAGQDSLPPVSEGGATGNTENELRSTRLSADTTARVNIPAFRHDLRLLAAKQDVLERAHADDRAAIKTALLRLQQGVEGVTERLNTPSLMSPGSVAPFHDLEVRVERLAQSTERSEDAARLQIEDLQERMEDVEELAREISSSVTRVSTAITQVSSNVTSLTNSFNSLAARVVQPTAPTPPRAVAPALSPAATRRRPREPSPTREFTPSPRRTLGYGSRNIQQRRVDSRASKRPRTTPPAPLPIEPLTEGAAPLSPIDAVVRFGPVNWSKNEHLLRDQLFATAHCAWDKLPAGLFLDVKDLELDAQSAMHVTMRFPSLSLALSFVDAWVENKHSEPTLRTVQAHVV
ncbi:hypothetical protein C8Q79DRAFT_919259 [Trametes meyenii]|nr:hypothetical protein C8Q79DRAFT_919259 [Trametes meyenii]